MGIVPIKIMPAVTHLWKRMEIMKIVQTMLKKTQL